MACGIWFHDQGVKLGPPASGAWSLSHRLPGKSLDSVSCGLSDKGPQFLGGWRPPSVPCHVGLLMGHLASSEPSREKNLYKKPAGKTKVTMSHNLITKVTPHLLCHMLLVTQSSPGTVWERTTQGRIPFCRLAPKPHPSPAHNTQATLLERDPLHLLALPSPSLWFSHMLFPLPGNPFLHISAWPRSTHVSRFR